MDKKVLGILCLENKPMKTAGSMGNPDTFEFPVIYETVPGATAERVTRCDKTLVASYRSSARRLVERGAAAITGNCGFTALFQKDLAASVSVPVLTSSLVLIPFVHSYISHQGNIGILTFNGPSLMENYFEPMGIDVAALKLVVKGVEKKPSWRQLLNLKPAINTDLMREELLQVCEELRAEDRKIESVILECTGMPPFRQDVLRALKVPIYDIVTATHFLMRSLSDSSF